MWAAIHRREPDALDESEWTTVAWTCPWLSWTRGMSRAHQAFSSFWSVSVDVHGSSPELQTILSASCGGFSLSQLLWMSNIPHYCTCKAVLRGQAAWRTHKKVCDGLASSSVSAPASSTPPFFSSRTCAACRLHFTTPRTWEQHQHQCLHVPAASSSVVHHQDNDDEMAAGGGGFDADDDDDDDDDAAPVAAAAAPLPLPPPRAPSPDPPPPAIPSAATHTHTHTHTCAHATVSRTALFLWAHCLSVHCCSLLCLSQ